jgi:uncharacterized cupredoxin-like copper-binding protein
MKKAERILPLAAVAMLAVLALGAIAGCGGGDDDDEGEAAETEATTTEAGGGGGGGGATVPVSLVDFAIDPANPAVDAGTVTFKVSNDGEVTHNLEVEGEGVEEELEQDLPPGESWELTVELTQPGTYEWYCPVDGHADQGMEGELTVK